MTDAKDTQTRVDTEKLANGLGGLALTIVKLLHELMQRQALKRYERGELSEEEIERAGRTFQAQAQELARLCDLFGVKEEELNLDLGPLGKLM